MKINLLCVGKSKSKFISDGEIFYINKINHYFKIKYITAKDLKLREGKNNQLVIETESERLTQLLDPDAYIIVLDRTGRQHTSEKFSHLFEETLNRGYKNVTFIIGGVLGLSKSLKQKAHSILSLSNMTFTHEMSRLILLEQIYRSLSILRGEKYHK